MVGVFQRRQRTLSPQKWFVVCVVHLVPPTVLEQGQGDGIKEGQVCLKENSETETTACTCFICSSS